MLLFLISLITLRSCFRLSGPPISAPSCFLYSFVSLMIRLSCLVAISAKASPSYLSQAPAYMMVFYFTSALSTRMKKFLTVLYILFASFLICLKRRIPFSISAVDYDLSIYFFILFILFLSKRYLDCGFLVQPFSKNKNLSVTYVLACIISNYKEVTTGFKLISSKNV